MVKKSKKSLSKRGKGMRHDARWAHFRAEQARKSHRAIKKGEKPDPLKFKRIRRDPEIPNLFPYKAEIIRQLLKHKKVTSTEINEVMTQKFQEQLAQDIASNQLIEKQNFQIPEAEQENFQQERGLRRNVFKTELQQVVEQSDIILEVLDARDPEGTRNLEAENLCAAQKKPFVLLLNKVDLVPQQVLQQWLEYYRTMNIPTVMFKCPLNFQKGSVRYASAQTGMSDSGACVGALELKRLIHKLNDNKRIICCCIGYPNTGKSSVINSLANRPACVTAPIPGQTRVVQEIHIDQRIRLLDSPGVVSDVRNNVVLREEELVDPVGEVIRVFQMVQDVKSLYDLYEVPFEGLQSLEITVQDFIVKLGKKFGRIKHGGVIDQEQVAREIVRDWNRGFIPFYKLPAQQAQVQQVMGNWGGIDVGMLNQFNFDVLGHLTNRQGIALH